jgi:hypothetical protein
MNDLAVLIYRLAAKIMGIALCRHKIVDSVYVNRGVGRGEVAFARSDIDLSLIVRTPDPDSCDHLEIYSLYRWVRALRCINPALTHLMVYDLHGLDRFIRTDSYMGSQESRSMILLAGKPAPMPHIPVRREDAVRYIPFWVDRLFPMAIKQNNRRNLRKITTEIWKAWAVAQGIVDKPYVTLREAERKAALHPIGSELATAVSDPHRAVQFVLKLAGILHDDLLPPLEKLREPLVIPMLMPPRSRERILVVLPSYNSPLPAEIFEPNALIATPEMLHLSVRYFNPFYDWNLPPELRRLGYTSPQPIDFVRACLLFGQENTLRLPGFARAETWLTHTIIAFNEYSIPYLRKGKVPPPMPEAAIRALLEHNPNCSEYYLKDYRKLYHQTKEQLRILERMESPGIYPTVDF